MADIIMEKITEKQTEVGTVMSEVSGCPAPQLDPRVVEVYRGVSKVSFDSEFSDIQHCDRSQSIISDAMKPLEGSVLAYFLYD